MNATLKFVLELYQTARAVPPAELPDRALRMLQTVVPFRSAVQSEGRYTGRSAEFFAAHPFDEPPEMLEEFLEFNRVYPITVAEASKVPGRPRTFYAPVLYSGKELAGFRDYVRRYRHDWHLLIADIQGPLARGNWLSLYRPEDWEDFGERDQRLVSVLMPHLSEAIAINQHPFLSVGLSAHATEPALRALVAPDGRILHCGDALFALITAEWAEWTGVRLPKPLLAQLTRAGSARIAGGAVHIFVSLLGDALLLTAARIGGGEFANALEGAHIALDGAGIELLIEALEALSLAAFLCDGDGNVGALTPSARALVASESALSVVNGRVGATLPDDARVLSDAIEAAAKACGTRGTLVSRTLIIGRERSHATPVVLDIVALRSSSLPGRSLDFIPRVLIVARGSRGSNERRAAVLCAAFGLTSSEAEIALSIAAGISAQHIAERRGVAAGTVRSQIKTILAKVGVGRQAQLAARVAQL